MMPSRRPNRRTFFRLAGAGGIAVASFAGPAKRRNKKTIAPQSGIVVPDDGWRLVIDEAAAWRDDAIFLPEETDIAALPVNPPTGGWDRLSGDAGIAVTLPATVEQHYWGKFGTRPYAPEEYSYAAKDPVPQNGAYAGVSWWWRDIDIPAAFKGRRIILAVRGARMRAEVYLNRRLAGYSIMEELPFECDLTDAADPGGRNRLAIRITNPGGRYDWVDGDTITWGKVGVYRSHGFGGIDRGMTLEAHPLDGRIGDLWVLNRPQLRTVDVFVRIVGGGAAAERRLALDVIDEKNGRPLAAQVRFAGHTPDGACKFTVTAKRARLWNLAAPQLYRLRARFLSPAGGVSARETRFGFRWFAPEGIGKDAVFRLNGKRIKLYSAISWGYWGLNGLWPTPELAEKEVKQAKALGLNCLSFHRNVGKEDVFAAQDRLGLLRTMEPGGGKFALGRLPDGVRTDANSLIMQKPQTEADKFSQAFMLAKCVAMVRAFRSHPSLIRYTLQNETNAVFSDPAALAVLDAMRAEDESRIVELNDGMVAPPISATQAWYAPYDSRLHRTGAEPWGGWWNDHQGAGDQWYDAFYRDPEHFNYRQPLRGPLIEYGEMEGCAVPDNHILAIAEIMQHGTGSYDLQDRREIAAGYGAFLDRWGFRTAFPTTESLFLAIGRKCYESWQQYLENARINDATDAAAISGWESTAIDNHSGLVDNLRNCKSDPDIVRASLLPVRPIAKQRGMVVARGVGAIFDLYFCNDTGKPVRGKLAFTMTDPAGRKTVLGVFAAPVPKKDRFSVLVKEAFATPPLIQEGAYRFTFSLSGMPYAAHVRDIWVADAKRPPVAGKTLRIAAAGLLQTVRNRLESLPGVAVTDYAAGGEYAAIVTSGLTVQSTEAQRLGGDAGVQLQRDTGSPPVPGALAAEALAAVKAGTPLLVIAQEDGLADGLAAQLAAAGAFAYAGQVGKYRAPWMGNWYFLRAHPVYEGLPVDRAMGNHHQAHGRQANGLFVDGPGVDVFAGYGRDHDRGVGAGTFTARLGAGKILFQRVPDLNGAMQLRFLSNALAWLCA
jgi:beta-galactosidase